MCRLLPGLRLRRAVAQAHRRVGAQHGVAQGVGGAKVDSLTDDTVVATLTAQVLDLDEDSIEQGLYGFNGILIGAALPTFIAVSPQLWVYVVVGAAASTVFTAVSS